MRRKHKRPDPIQWLIALCFLFGGLSGCINSCRTDFAQLQTDVESYFQNYSVGYNHLHLFFTNVLHQMKYPLILFVFGFTIFGSIAAVALVCIKGYTLAFAFSALIRVHGIKGYFLIPVMFGSQCLFVLPFFFLLASVCFRLSFSFLRKHYGNKHIAHLFYGQESIHSFMTHLAVVAFFAFICAAFDTYVTPQILLLI